LDFGGIWTTLPEIRRLKVGEWFAFSSAYQPSSAPGYYLLLIGHLLSWCGVCPTTMKYAVSVDWTPDYHQKPMALLRDVFSAFARDTPTTLAPCNRRVV